MLQNVNMLRRYNTPAKDSCSTPPRANSAFTRTYARASIMHMRKHKRARARTHTPNRTETNYRYTCQKRLAGIGPAGRACTGAEGGTRIAARVRRGNGVGGIGTA